MRMALLIAICFATIGLASLFERSDAEAKVWVAIDLTRQRMHVDGNEGTYDWPISSARSGFSTPGGSYAPKRLELMHYSHRYHMSPMPHAIFFRGGYAIHGTDATGSLGRPASHGCVRLSPGNAARLYAMVKAEGARISISGTPPVSPQVSPQVLAGVLARAKRAHGHPAFARVRSPRRPFVSYGYSEAQSDGYEAPPRHYYGYRLGYTYAPAYFFAPQVHGGSPRRQLPFHTD